MEKRWGREERPRESGRRENPLTPEQRRAAVQAIEVRAQRDRERLEREYEERDGYAAPLGRVRAAARVHDLDLFRARAWALRANGRAR